MLNLYSRVNNVSNSEAYREICEALQNGEFSQTYQETAPARDEQEPPEQSPLADIRTVHQTFSMLLGVLTLSKNHR